MNIDKKYKIECVCSKDSTGGILQSVYVYQEEKAWAVATNGKALAEVPVNLENDELKKGNSIKATDLAFQRKNPAVKKQDSVFACLSPLNGTFPNFQIIWPKEPPKVTIGLNISLLKNLADALGSEIVKIEIIDNEKAFRVYAIDNKAKGLLMPCEIEKG